MVQAYKNRPAKISSRVREKVGLAIIILFVASFYIASSAEEFTELIEYKDEGEYVSNYEKKFSEVRKRLDSINEVGFITDPPEPFNDRDLLMARYFHVFFTTT